MFFHGKLHASSILYASSFLNSSSSRQDVHFCALNPLIISIDINTAIKLQRNRDEISTSTEELNSIEGDQNLTEYEFGTIIEYPAIATACL